MRGVFKESQLDDRMQLQHLTSALKETKQELNVHFIDSASKLSRLIHENNTQVFQQRILQVEQEKVQLVRSGELLRQEFEDEKSNVWADY